MPGRSICLYLLIALSLPLSGSAKLLAKDDVIVVRPGVLKTVPGPTKRKTSKRRNPRVGTRQTEYVLSGVSIARATGRDEPAATKRRKGSGNPGKSDPPSADDDARRSKEVETVEVERKDNAIHIKAEEEAAGQVFTMTARFTVRTQQYKRFSRDEFGKKIQPYNSWVDLPDRETTQDYTVAVVLEKLPLALVPNGKEATFTLPDGLERVSFRRSSRPEAEVKLEAENRLRILAKKPGDTEFEMRYELAGKKLSAILPVRVIQRENVVSINVKEGGRADAGFGEIDELFDLQGGEVVRVDVLEDPSVAQIAFDAYRVNIKGVKEGKTRAVLAYRGAVAGKGRKRQRCQVQVPMIITVK